jgi:hypothetical protein
MPMMRTIHLAAVQQRRRARRHLDLEDADELVFESQG